MIKKLLLGISVSCTLSSSELLTAKKTPSPLKQLSHYKHSATLTVATKGSTHVTLCPNETLVAASSGNSSEILLFDIQQKKSRTIHPVGANSSIIQTAFSPDGQQLAILCTTGIHFFDLTTHTRLGEDQIDGQPILSQSIAFSPNGTMIAASRYFNNDIVIWHPRTRGLAATLPGHVNPVKTVLFSPNNRTVISSSYDGIIRVWDIETQRTTLEAQRTTIDYLSGYTPIAYGCDENLFVSGDTDRTVRLWDIRQRPPVASLRNYTTPINTIALCKNNKTLIAGTTGRLEVYSLRKNAILDTMPGNVTSVACSPNGNHLIAGLATAKALYFKKNGSTVLSNKPEDIRERISKLLHTDNRSEHDEKKLKTLQEMYPDLYKQAYKNLTTDLLRKIIFKLLCTDNRSPIDQDILRELQREYPGLYKQAYRNLIMVLR